MITQNLKTSFKFGVLIVAMGFVVGCEKDLDYDTSSYLNRFDNYLFYDTYFGSYRGDWVSVYCTDDISVRFNRPINISDSLLPDAFYIIETDTKEEFRIPADVYLSEDGKVVSIIPQIKLNEGGYNSYWLVVDLVKYGNSDSFPYANPWHYSEREGYRFSVNNKMVITFKSNVDSNYRNSQYGRYSTFYMDDTAYFNTSDSYYGRKFSHWDLPGVNGVNYTVNNATLKIIFDCANYFYNNNIKDGGITITAIYK